MEYAKRKELIDEMAELTRENLSYESILINKYHIMITFFFGEVNREAHEQKITNLRTTRPDLTCIPLEKRSELPAAIWNDKELDGMDDCFDRLEKSVKRCMVDDEYEDIVERSSTLILLYEKIITMASIKNTDAIRLLLSLEKDIYDLDSFDSTVAGNKICEIAHNHKQDTSSWPQHKRKVYELLDYLVRGLHLFRCSTLDELRERLHSLETSNQFPKGFSAITKLSAINLDRILKSDDFYRIVAQDHLFIAIADLASMGLGEKILYLLDQEDHLGYYEKLYARRYCSPFQKRIGG